MIFLCHRYLIITYLLPIYTIDRMIKETKKDFYDGSHIYYVNGAYQGEDEVGKLMHDFREKKVEDM